MTNRSKVLAQVTRRVRSFQAGVILDANMALLYLSNLALGTTRALASPISSDVYTTDHVIVLAAAINKAANVAMTPHVLTEVDYFVREKFARADTKEIYPVLRAFVRTCVEPLKPGPLLLADPLAQVVGVADLSQATIKKKRRLLVTADAPLIAKLARRSVEVLNPTNHAWS